MEITFIFEFKMYQISYVYSKSPFGTFKKSDDEIIHDLRLIIKHIRISDTHITCNLGRFYDPMSIKKRIDEICELNFGKKDLTDGCMTFSGIHCFASCAKDIDSIFN